LPPLAWMTDSAFPVVIGAIAAAALIIQRHRANLARLRSRTEPRLHDRPQAPDSTPQQG
jgi:glycerol-3-phosphate acyltransferase PlsY